ncbi:MAG: ATP-binding cassette domain-containing protein, partial [Gammaproteobacteria bacterium]
MSDSTVPVLSVKGLECVRNDIVLFSGLDFRLAGGELLQITGANGSGKTSLLRIICGLAQPSEGAVYWNARDIQEYNAEYSREISYIGHYNGIKAELTPQENLNIAQVLCQ